MAARFAQSLVAPWELRMQAYEDDPMLIAAGSREQRLRFFTAVLLFWAALDFDLSWKEGQTGPRVAWIGDDFTLLQDGVVVQLIEAKLSKSWCRSLDTCRGVRQLREWPDHLSRCCGEHSLIVPSGRRRETR